MFIATPAFIAYDSGKNSTNTNLENSKKKNCCFNYISFTLVLLF